MAVLTLRNVTKTYGSGDKKVEALKETNFEAERGELIAIVGPSGSGKSTFLTIVGGLLTPSTGEVIINGANFAKIKEKRRSKLRLKEIGFILQASNTVPFLSVNNQFKLLDRVKDRNMNKMQLDSLLKDLDIDHLRNKYPTDLSGGERQRLAIARALYTHPTIILADEPTASLDSERAFEVIELLQRETKSKNTTTIVVTHDTRLIDYFDKVYNMTDGTLTLERVKEQPVEEK